MDIFYAICALKGRSFSNLFLFITAAVSAVRRSYFTTVQIIFSSPL